MVDIDLELYRAADAEAGLDSPLASSMTTTVSEEISYQAVADGAYYLRVYSLRADSSGGYSLTAGTSP